MVPMHRIMMPESREQEQQRGITRTGLFVVKSWNVGFSETGFFADSSCPECHSSVRDYTLLKLADSSKLLSCCGS